MKLRTMIAAALLVLAAVACGPVENSQYAGGLSGCQHALDVAIDAGDGVLTDEDILKKSGEIYNRLRTAEPDLAEAGKLLRQAAVNGDAPRWVATLTVLMQQCRSHRYVGTGT